jgi:hypothetical protein
MKPMILSEAKSFLFLKGRKVAGTSAEMILSTLCGPRDIITPITPIDERRRIDMGGIPAQNYSKNRSKEQKYIQALRDVPQDDLSGMKPPASRYYNHMSLIEFLSVYGSLPSGFRIICVERNPYSKVISAANMSLTFQSYKSGGDMSASIGDVSRAVDDLLRNGRAGRVRNIDLYKDKAGQMRAQVLKYEKLEGDLTAFLSTIGVTSCPPLPHAKKGILANRFDPAEFFTRDQLSRINELFSDEFETFGYAMV